MFLYQLHELKKTAMLPAHIWSEANGLFLNMFALDETAVGRYLTAGNEMLERSTRVYKKPLFNIKNIDVCLANEKIVRCEVTEDIDITHPFCNLVRFKRTHDGQEVGQVQPNILLVAPYSGHFSSLLRDTVRTLLHDHNVWITDWKDAKFIAMAHGAFTLDDYVDFLLQAITKFQGNVNIIAVCQPVVPVMMATAYLSLIDSPFQPKTITLMGGPIDTRVNPGKVNQFACEHDMDWFKRNIIDIIPPYYEGHERKVCPGFILLNGFMALNIDRHKEATMNHFQHLVQGDNESVENHRLFYDEYLSVLDIPAEYYLESIEKVFKTFDLPLGRMKFRGHPIKLENIRKPALLTIEGERDDISCLGQTYAALNLCQGIPSERKRSYVQKDVGHYGIFNGRKWREQIKPEIAAFIRQFSCA